MLRRSRGGEDQPRPLTFRHLRIDPSRREVWQDEQPVELTTLEFNLLHALASCPGHVLTREQVIKRVWRPDYFGDDRIVDVHVKALRRKPGDHADPDRIVQVLTNLLGNALHYTAPGGRVEVRLHPPNGAVGIAVSDTGLGIPLEHLPHVFDCFYRVDRSRAPLQRRRDRPDHRPHLVKATADRFEQRALALGRAVPSPSPSPQCHKPQKSSS